MKIVGFILLTFVFADACFIAGAFYAAYFTLHHLPPVEAIPLKLDPSQQPDCGRIKIWTELRFQGKTPETWILHVCSADKLTFAHREVPDSD